MTRRQLLLATSLVEITLLVIATAVIRFAGLTVEMSATLANLVIGLVLGLGLAAAGILLAGGRGRWFGRLKGDFETVLGMLEGLSVVDLAFIAALAGVCEEALFRGALQAWLESATSLPIAIAVASLAFGAVHAISAPYVVAATVLGVTFGYTFHLTGSLAAAIVAHGVYDFVLMYWGTRVRAPGTARD